MTETATMLTGPLGLGHEMMARGCGRLFERSGWRVRQLDSMSLLGPWRGGAGERLFKRPGRRARPVRRAALRPSADREQAGATASTGRPTPGWCLRCGPSSSGTRPTCCSACSPPVPRRPGSSRPRCPGCGRSCCARTCRCTGSGRREGTDLFLVTSAAAEASVRRYLPRAPVAVVPPPVRPEFYAAPPQQQARKAFGVSADAFCVLVIDSGWGFGPLLGAVSELADAGVHVLAVAGRDRRIERRAARAGRRRGPGSPRSASPTGSPS